MNLFHLIARIKDMAKDPVKYDLYTVIHVLKAIQTECGIRSEEDKLILFKIREILRMYKEQIETEQHEIEKEIDGISHTITE